MLAERAPASARRKSEPASCIPVGDHTGVCEIDTHLDGAGVVNVQGRACASMCQHARAALIKTISARPTPLNRAPSQEAESF